MCSKGITDCGFWTLESYLLRHKLIRLDSEAICVWAVEDVLAHIGLLTLFANPPFCGYTNANRREYPTECTTHIGSIVPNTNIWVV